MRLDLPEDLRTSYAVADKRLKFRIAAENPMKPELVLKLIKKHPDDSILVIGQYVKPVSYTHLTLPTKRIV